MMRVRIRDEAELGSFVCGTNGWTHLFIDDHVDLDAFFCLSFEYSI